MYICEYNFQSHTAKSFVGSSFSVRLWISEKPIIDLTIDIQDIFVPWKKKSAIHGPCSINKMQICICVQARNQTILKYIYACICYLNSQNKSHTTNLSSKKLIQKTKKHWQFMTTTLVIDSLHGTRPITE